MNLVFFFYSCRHELIAKYFGDPRPECNKSCDFCQNPKTAKEQARNMKFCQTGKKKASLGSLSANFEYGVPDYSLYGGGRWGYKE